jgi:hypothetical protein
MRSYKQVFVSAKIVAKADKEERNAVPLARGIVA